VSHLFLKLIAVLPLGLATTSTTQSTDCNFYWGKQNVRAGFTILEVSIPPKMSLFLMNVLVIRMIFLIYPRIKC
jgi:hypothetical protein